MKTIWLYAFLVLETFLSLFVGISPCLYGPNLLLKVVAAVLLALVFTAVLYLIYISDKNHKIIVALIVGITVITLNHFFLGLIFGWAACPVI
ncbi:MAG: hypothetical protein JKX84_02485 [Flavobacteriales bacterium]|nr:hypothetical protein [Flavobacteriales bacterium]